jgi:hypothetical protein
VRGSSSRCGAWVASFNRDVMLTSDGFGSGATPWAAVQRAVARDSTVTLIDDAWTMYSRGGERRSDCGEHAARPAGARRFGAGSLK